MRNIWFTADTHYLHANIIRYTGRPFDNADEMDEALIYNWNSVVGVSDVVYHLGDFAFGRGSTPEKITGIINRLHGQINLIPGNHDRDKKIKNISRLRVVDSIYTIKPAKMKITLCHWPMMSWPGSHKGSWHLFGHVHGKLETESLSFDVGVDANNYTPVHLDDVIMHMSNKIIATARHQLMPELKRKPRSQD
jgi:calcineurin-like phosphoesterase family protein